jgi:D-alanine transaminase
MSRTVYLNGEYLPAEEALIPVEERAFNFADSLYEVSRVYGGTPFTLEEHYQRMKRGADILKLEMNFGVDDLREIILKLMEMNDTPEASAYYQYSRGSAPRDHPFPEVTNPNLVVFVKPFEALSLEERYQGRAAITHQDLRHELCDIKTTALIPNVLAKQAAIEAGAYEALLIRGRFISEGSATTAYIVKDGVIRTYPLGNILPGITRSVILDLAADYEDITLREVPFTPDELMEADEAFITGSTLEIMPIVEVDGGQIGSGVAGPVTRKLIDYYIKRVKRDCGQYWAE